MRFTTLKTVIDLKRFYFDIVCKIEFDEKEVHIFKQNKCIFKTDSFAN